MLFELYINTNNKSATKHENVNNGEHASFDTNNMKILMIILLTGILIVGVFGNILNIVVLGRQSMKKISTFRFLFYLSIIDLLVLLCCTTDALLTFGMKYEIRLSSELMCRAHTFLAYLFSHMSSIVLSVISIERFFVICNDRIVSLFSKIKLNVGHRSKSSFFKKYRIETIMLVILILLILENIHFLFLLNLNYTEQFEIDENKLRLHEQENDNHQQYDFNFIKKDEEKDNLQIKQIDEAHIAKQKEGLFKISSSKSCFPLANTDYYFFLDQVWIWVDISMYCLIPFFIMFTCSLAIFIETRHKTKTFMANFGHNNKSLHKKKMRRKQQVLIVLTATNTFFIMCTLPYCILYYHYKSNTSEEANEKVAILVHSLVYLNNSLNFIIYGMFSSKYREELKKMCSSGRTISSNSQMSKTKKKKKINLNDKKTFDNTRNDVNNLDLKNLKENNEFLKERSSSDRKRIELGRFSKNNGENYSLVFEIKPVTFA